MIQPNKGTKKLIKILDKMQQSLQREITEIIHEKLQMNMNLAAALSTKDYSEIVKENAGTKENIERELKLLRETNPELEYRFHKIKWIHILISEGHAFNEYDILQQLFDELDFDVNYQIEVLGYLLKHATIAFFNLEKDMEEARKDQKIIDSSFFEDIFRRELEYTESGLDKKTIMKAISMNGENYLTDSLEIIKNYKIIDQYIDENGNFIGTENVDPLLEALQMKQIRMPKKQKELIAKTIIDRYKEQKTKEIVVKDKTHQSHQNQPNKKEKYQATQLLKALLEGEMPKEYMPEEDLRTITNAMIILNYSDEQIAKIQKNIIKNNLEIERLQQAKKLDSAKIKFLTSEQISLLDCTEALINSEESLVNPIYEKISENLAFIKNELLNVCDKPMDSEELAIGRELISLAFEEIKGTIDSYCYSDYRFVLELTKKDSE